jgi:hypothetical protein
MPFAFSLLFRVYERLSVHHYFTLHVQSDVNWSNKTENLLRYMKLCNWTCSERKKTAGVWNIITRAKILSHSHRPRLTNKVIALNSIACLIFLTTIKFMSGAVLFQKSIFAQLVKKFSALMEPEGSLSCLQQPVTSRKHPVNSLTRLIS